MPFMKKIKDKNKKGHVSKYSSFCNDASSSNNTVCSNEEIDKLNPGNIFTKVSLNDDSPTKKSKKKKKNKDGCWKKICCFCCCCCRKKSKNHDSLDGDFYLVQPPKQDNIDTTSKNPSRTSTLRLGDKTLNTAKFVSEVLNCRDVFLQKLEFASDGSLTRRKKLGIPHVRVNYDADDDLCTTELSATPPRSGAPRRFLPSSTPPLSPLLAGRSATLPALQHLEPMPPLETEEDIDRLVALHNRSGLQTRSESMASVYSGAGESNYGSVTVKGQVEFGLLYNYKMGALEINVKRCRDLAPVDTKRNRSDPYVKVYLLPDKSKSGKRKTKVRKHTLQPVFDECLRFTQPLSALPGRALWLSVWHADMFGRNHFLGEVVLPLQDKVFDDPTPKWYNLQERTEQFEEQQGSKGDLIVGLKFEVPDQGNIQNMRTKGTLHVLVKEAKNLCATKPNGSSDVFCKSYLLPERGRNAKQKTGVSRRTLNPRWEHCFTYRGVSLSELEQRALELSVWDRDRLSSNDFMGGVRFSLGKGVYMGNQVSWMDSAGKEVSLWQTMMQRPNFWVEGSVPLRSSLSN